MTLCRSVLRDSMGRVVSSKTCTSIKNVTKLASPVRIFVTCLWNDIGPMTIASYDRNGYLYPAKTKAYGINYARRCVWPGPIGWSAASSARTFFKKADRYQQCPRDLDAKYIVTRRTFSGMIFRDDYPPDKNLGGRTD